jgi:hypothetical protein
MDVAEGKMTMKTFVKDLLNNPVFWLAAAIVIVLRLLLH